MANNGNLKTLSPNEARIQGAKGGIASGAARRRKRDIRFALAALMEGKQADGKTGAEALAVILFQRALEGDLKAIVQVEAWTLATNTIEEQEESSLWLGI